MIRRIVFFIAVVVFGAGCAGPKRLAPLNSTIPTVESGTSVHLYPILLGVGLAEKESSLELQANGKCIVLDGENGRRLGYFSGGTATLVCQEQGGSIDLQWERVRGQVLAVKLQPLDPETHVIFDGREYKGEFLVIPAPQGPGLTLINNIELESYLQGVLPWEIGRPGKEALAALEAQAVAARTYTVSKLGSRASRGFDVVSTVMDQVYRGCRDEDAQCNRAIESTFGLVLQHGNKEINAYYSSCCGGTNSQIEEVWPRGAVPYLRSHLDAANSSSPAFCVKSRHFRWQEKWDVASLEKIIKKTLPQYVDYMNDSMRKSWAGTVFIPRDSTSSAYRPGRLLDLDVQERTSSGRIARLVIATTAGSYSVRGDRVRWVFPPADGKSAILRSAFFDIKLQRQGNSLQSIIFDGRGNGHGLGMCQSGALEMARQGYSYKVILSHYYPGSKLVFLGVSGANHGR